jgi:hypothetical protein
MDLMKSGLDEENFVDLIRFVIDLYRDYIKDDENGNQNNFSDKEQDFQLEVKKYITDLIRRNLFK